MYKQIQTLFKLILISTLLFSTNQCLNKDLKVVETTLCDDFDFYRGKCNKPIQGEKTYQLELPSKIETWNDFSSFVRKRAKIKPGFLLKFNRDFTVSEQELITSSYKAAYYFWDSRGKMEGFAMGEDWVYSYESLGDIIKYRQLEKANLDSFINLQEIFPVELKLYYFSDLVKGEVPFKIDLSVR